MSDKLKYHMNMLNSIDRKVGGPGDWSYIIDALNSIDTNLGSVGISGLIELAQNAYPSESASGNPIYLDDGADNIPVKELIVELTTKQAGTGDPSPTNVRAISGYEGVTVKRCGKNLLYSTNNSATINGVTGTKNSDGTWTVNGTATATLDITVFSGRMELPVGNYTVSGCIGGDSTTWTLGVRIDNDLGARRYVSQRTSNTAFTIEKGEYIARVYINVKSGTALSNVVFSPMIVSGVDATAEYEPYQGEVYSIAFPTNVGTVYGGTLNVTTGELVVDRYCMRVDGTKIPSIAALTNNYRIGIMNIATLFGAPLAKYAGNNTVCAGNWLPKRNQGYSADTTGFYFYSNTAIYVFFPKSLITSQDIALARQYFVDHPLDICYELETPQTYQLTPTEVATLLGGNTIFSDGNIQLTYRADTTTLINKLKEA